MIHFITALAIFATSQKGIDTPDFSTNNFSTMTTDKQATLSLGDRFPEVKGKLLTGESFTLPNDVEGKVTFLVTGYVQEAQYTIEEWTKPVQARFDDSDDFKLLEVPMIEGPSLLRWYGDWVMRPGIPENFHDNVLTYYGKMDDYYQLFGSESKQDVHVFILDKNGLIRYKTKGKPSESDLETCYHLIENLQ